ncbi:MAG: hypothetical protein COZ06_30350 [Armatimonadetes bacterium CG_4_10_14_3_um_filter_66_18]|nr:hypothetical protein [Armatimonadota bacterium]OIP06384.1 MAG: hypothetical protein AUJ96_09295 [Armatimonadetes bacterium CG2_30_66_41]PIU92913.1 MAG: hypothetical protein COS65_15480 [Armatimonadetes bacterium CG06_land_8_20_14_3_00_66_21]PIW20996.1 MAG: hypothetical protein COW34_00545 [Armatimonadetes bacterium CG17_big_fil_post_rev_8_21_14_2_50_66_6]PIX39120.1 MAG: hypothetical protein COZ57_28880 [Armatimonadetes bacterium CG_4_8_14_3_um_filter_66_20]PIY39023.1 MAG: hypothetical prote
MIQWIAERGRRECETAVASGDQAILRLGQRTSEVYTFTTVLNAGDPLAVNAACREALRKLSAAG